MLAADLELRGPSRIAWIETMYLADRRRTMPEIAAALQALGEHGDANGAVPRERVIQAYLVLIKERQPMAGFVAAHLAEWEYWDAAREYAALLASNVPLDPGSRGADRRLSRTLPAGRGQGRARIAAGRARRRPASRRPAAHSASGSDSRSDAEIRMLDATGHVYRPATTHALPSARRPGSRHRPSGGDGSGDALASRSYSSC